MSKHVLSLARLVALVNGGLLVWAIMRGDETAILRHLGAWLVLAALAAVVIGLEGRRNERE